MDLIEGRGSKCPVFFASLLIFHFLNYFQSKIKSPSKKRSHNVNANLLITVISSRFQTKAPH